MSEIFAPAPHAAFPDNFWARGANGMAVGFERAVQSEADLSRLRVDTIGPSGVWLRHLPSSGFRAPQPAPGNACPAGAVFMLCGCAYLSASFWPETIATARQVLETHGVGSYDSAPLSGESAHHERVKRLLETLYHALPGRAYLTVSASMANLAAVPMLVGRHDTVFADAQCHMTLTQGMALSQARVWRYRHGDMADLERKLETCARADPARTRRRLIVTDGVFSMSGHVCDLPALVALARRHGCRLMVDEAHALGALGPRGFGTADYWGMDPDCIDVVTGTLAKAVGAQGGYIVCHDTSDGVAVDYEYVTNRVFSSGVPASTAAAAAEVLGQMADVADARVWEAEPARNTYMDSYRRQRRNASILRQYMDTLRARGCEASGDDAPGALHRLVVGSDDVLFEIQRQLYARGVYACGMVYPVVPQGRGQFRFTVMAALSEADMHACGTAIVEVCEDCMTRRSP